MCGMRNYRDLHVYHRAHSVALRVHAVAQTISSHNYPGLPAQLRRASAAVPANIVEGCGTEAQRDFARFLQLALAANSETGYHLKFARDVIAIPTDAYRDLARENLLVKRMLAALLRLVRMELSEAERTSGQSVTAGALDGVGDDAPSPSELRPDADALARKRAPPVTQLPSAP